MKKNLFNLFAAASVVAISFAGCVKDPCKDIVCQNGGTCAEGICACPSGYEGDLCAAESRTKFLKTGNVDATYAVVELGTRSGSKSYSVVVKGSSTSNTKLLITNFWGLFTNPVTATISGSKVTLARQEPDADKYFVEGSGVYANGKITMTYKVTNEAVTPITTDDFAGTSIWTKQ